MSRSERKKREIPVDDGVKRVSNPLHFLLLKPNSRSRPDYDKNSCPVV